MEDSRTVSSRLSATSAEVRALGDSLDAFQTLLLDGVVPLRNIIAALAPSELQLLRSIASTVDLHPFRHKSGRLGHEISFASIPATIWRKILNPTLMAMLRSYLNCPDPHLVAVEALHVPDSVKGPQVRHRDHTVGKRLAVQVVINLDGDVTTLVVKESHLATGVVPATAYDESLFLPVSPGAPSILMDNHLAHRGAAASTPRRLPQLFINFDAGLGSGDARRIRAQQDFDKAHRVERNSVPCSSIVSL